MILEEQKNSEKKRGSRSDSLRKKFHGKSFLIPSVITMVAIFCGFLAIISAIRGDFIYAVRCVFIAIVLDGLDGRVARRLNATSAFGREFDSMSDVVSFGVAPAVMVYIWGFSGVADEFGVLISFIFVVCAATRLARFNVLAAEEDTTHGFVGLPSPAAAAVLVCVIYLYPVPLQEPILVFLAMLFSTCVALLMISSFPFFSVKRLTFRSKQAPLWIVGLAFVVALIWKFPAPTLFVLALGYAVSGPLLWILKRKPDSVEALENAESELAH